MSFLSSDLEARPTPLLVMARDADHGKCTRSESPNHGGRLPPSHQARADTAPTMPHCPSGGASVHDDGFLGLLLVVELIITYGLVLAFYSSKCGGDVGGGC
jgi:hypothetical protein